jgi:hypothetical protein
MRWADRFGADARCDFCFLGLNASARDRDIRFQGVERTAIELGEMSAYDPKRASQVLRFDQGSLDFTKP